MFFFKLGECDTIPSKSPFIRIIKETSKQSAKRKQIIRTTQSEEAVTSQDRTKMNHATSNTTSSSSSFCLHLRNLTSISPEVRGVFAARTVANVLTRPVIIVLNILVMVAVKTKPQLRTKSNIALACLSTTDLTVGLVVQPLHITAASLFLKGERMFCPIIDISTTTTFICIFASLHHLVLMSAERYVAIKHPYAYEAVVTEARIILASCLAWAAAIIFFVENFLPTAVVAVSESLLLIFPMYFNVSVYKEVCRHKKQIAANQVSLEAKEELLKKKKAFYTTVIVLLVILLFYIPSNILLVILVSLKERIPSTRRVTAVYVITLLPVLNSMFNPLIYAFRVRHFRVAFIQLLSRKTTTQAEELEWKIFGTRQIGVNRNVNTGQGNQTSKDNPKLIRRADPHGGWEQTPL